MVYVMGQINLLKQYYCAVYKNTTKTCFCCKRRARLANAINHDSGL